MAATASIALILKINIPVRFQSENKATNFTKLTKTYPNSSPNSKLKTFAIRAFDPENNGEGKFSNGNDGTGDGVYIAQEDVIFLLKLVSGSIAGAAVIKYGSIVFPEITKPNIVQALAMILTPVAIAIWLLIKQSSEERQT